MSGSWKMSAFQISLFVGQCAFATQIKKSGDDVLHINAVLFVRVIVINGSVLFVQ